MAPGRARRSGAGISGDRDRSCSSRGEVPQAGHLTDPLRAKDASRRRAWPETGHALLSVARTARAGHRPAGRWLAHALASLAVAAAGAACAARRGSAAARPGPVRLGAARVDDVPGEVVAAEVVGEAVAGGLAGRVLGEGVERFAAGGDLSAAVGPRDHAELARA